MTLTLAELRKFIVDKDIHCNGDPINIWCEINGKRGLVPIKRVEFKNEDSYDIVLVID